MVVMDHVNAQLKPPQDARPQIKKVLTRLHAQGYVFGDLREPNILFDAGGKVKFVDFD
jgi:serine/threonine protein kinase